MKKLLLIIALLISALGLNAQSVTTGGLRYTVTSETPAECEVSGYSGEPDKVIIPSKVTISGEKYSVTSIGNYAFHLCYDLTSIEIPNSVTSIGFQAFDDCYSLKSIEIPSGVTSIGGYAFSGCTKLKSIEIPSGVTSIGYRAFYNCSSLTSIDFGENSQLTSIGERAFEGCSWLTSVTFGENSQLTSIGEYAFYECYSLTSIEIPSGVTSIGKSAFEGCSGLTSVTFGENSQLTSIGKLAFYGCSSLTSIDFGENSQLTSIGNSAFSGCSSLTSIEIPSGVTSIGSSAFSGCSSLTSIEIPSGVTSIGNYVFYGCSGLTSIVVESGNTVYDSRDNCNAIIETATNTLIAGCQNTVIPNTVTSIGGAFYGCSSLTSIEIPSGVTSIGGGAFYGCSSLTSIEIPSGVTSIGSSAFKGCSSLTSIEIPSGVTSIGNYAFEGCSGLTSVTFEENSQLTSIGEDAFEGCSSLTSIYCYAESVPETDSDAFYKCPSDMVIYVPAISVNAYKAASPWKNYTIIALSYAVTASSNPEEAGVITGTGEYELSDTVTLTATANEGYKFVNWTENGDVVSEEAEYSFEITKDRNLVANFELLSYNVTASVNPENAGVVTGAGTYNHGEEVTLTATANEGYKFVNWTENGEVVSEEAEYSFEVTKDRNLVANFELLSYNVTASVNPENAGVVTGAGTYNHGEDVTLTATANEGYKFINWTENGEVVSEEAEYSFEITKDRNLVANFELLSYNVTASLNPENAGVVTGAGTYNHGEEVTLTATANEGYKFINWTENGEVVSEEAEYSFVITSDRNLVANFELLSYNVTASLNPENAGEITGDGNYNHGDTVALIATANEGYKFVSWAENGEVISETSEYSFVVTRDVELIANFVSTEGVEELASSFDIYPNPVNDKLYIETLTQTQTIEIYDIYGRRQSMVNGQQSTVIDVSDLNSGVYFVKIVTENGESVQRFIKK